MFGAVVGDVAGSTYEAENYKGEDCEIFAFGSTFTDDSVLTLATAQHFVTGESYTQVYRNFGRAYPHAGYGGNFIRWLQHDDPKPYNSWGNGSAMRASPIGWVATDLDWALQEAKRSAEVTHNHPQGIKGAQAVAAAIYLARTGSDKQQIKSYIEQEFGYDLNRTIAEIRPTYEFDVSCDGSVPEAIIAFLESNNFEDAIRKAISVGGDSDTIACIAGGIAHAFYGDIPSNMVEYCRQSLDERLVGVMDEFWKRHREGTLVVSAAEADDDT